MEEIFFVDFSKFSQLKYKDLMVKQKNLEKLKLDYFQKSR